MRQQQAARARGVERFDGLLRGQVPARLGVQLPAEERRLAHEQVDVAREVRQPLARPRVPRIGERVRLVGQAKSERSELVVRQLNRSYLEAGCPERDVLLVLAQLER